MFNLSSKIRTAVNALNNVQRKGGDAFQGNDSSVHAVSEPMKIISEKPPGTSMEIVESQESRAVAGAVGAPPVESSEKRPMSLAEQFAEHRFVSGKYVPFHDAGCKVSVSPRASFRITAETKPEEIPIPEPYPVLRHQAAPELYLQTGCWDVKVMREVLSADEFAFGNGQRALDFGCLTGRMMRWLLDESRRGVEIWGVDIQADAIDWASSYMTPPFQFATTTTEPHLPFPEGYFDLIYGGSVFTHMNDLADAWLLELKRILKPAGRAYLSFNDENSVRCCLDKWPGTWDEVKFKECMRQQPDVTLSQVNFISIDQSPYASVFYNREYLSAKLNRLFRLKRIREEGFGWQSVYLVQKQ